MIASIAPINSFSRVSAALQAATPIASATAPTSGLQSLDQFVRNTPSAPALMPPYYGAQPQTLSEKLRHAWRTLRIGVPGLFFGKSKPDPHMNLHTPMQRLLNRVFPGEIYMAVKAKVERTPAEIAIPSGPETRPLDPRWFMPHLVFGKQERSFPVAANFDQDGNVNNNARHYQHGNFKGAQAPAVYVHVARKGAYTVLSYSLYFVDNLYANYHNHDWQPFQIYLQQQNGYWIPRFVMTHWHHGKQMNRWEDLKMDRFGRPFIEIEAGAHALLPLKKNARIPNDGGWNMAPDGSFYQRHPHGQYIPGTLTYFSRDANLIGTFSPEPLPGGYDTMTYDKYFGDNRVFGFFPEERGSDTLSGGPAASGPNGLYHNPIHPSLFFSGA